jgi:hypothetical protein
MTRDDLMKTATVILLCAASAGACVKGEGEDDKGHGGGAAQAGGAAGALTGGSTGVATGGSAGAGTGGSAGSGGAAEEPVDGGAVGPDGATGAGGSAATCPAAVLSGQGVTFTQSHDSGSAGLALVNSNIVTRAINGTFVDWNAELVNCGTTTICSPRAEIAFKDAGGATLAQFREFTTGTVYESSLGLSTKCLEPGQKGFVHAIANLPAPIAFASLRAAELSWSGRAPMDVTPVQDGPKILGAKVVQGGLGTSRVEGDVQIGAAAVSTVNVEVYVKNPQGLILDRLMGFGGEKRADTVWHFSAGIFDGLVMDFVAVLDFRKPLP